MGSTASWSLLSESPISAISMGSTASWSELSESPISAISVISTGWTASWSLLSETPSSSSVAVAASSSCREGCFRGRGLLGRLLRRRDAPHRRRDPPDRRRDLRRAGAGGVGGRHRGQAALAAQRGSSQGLGELAAGRVAIVGLLGERALQRLVEDGGAVREGADRRRLLEAVREHELHVPVPAKRRAAARCLVERARQRVLVGAPVDAPRRVRLLRRHVRERADDGADRGLPRRAGVDHAHEAEVGQVGVAVGVHQDVLRLDVAMHQARGVRGVERAGEALRGAGDLLGVEGAARLDEGLQVAPGDQPHGDERHAVRLVGLVHRHDGRVLERRRAPGLVAEARDEPLLGHELRADHLERDHAIRQARGAARAVHDAHAAASEDPLDHVTRELLARRQLAHAAILQRGVRTH